MSWFQIVFGVPHVLAFTAMNVWIVCSEPKSRMGWWMFIGAYLYCALVILVAVNPGTWPGWLQVLIAVPNTLAFAVFNVWVLCTTGPKSRNGWRLLVGGYLYLVLFLLLIVRRMPIYNR